MCPACGNVPALGGGPAKGVALTWQVQFGVSRLSAGEDMSNEKPITSLVFVGVIATQLGTYFGYVFPAVGLPTLPWPLYNGSSARDRRRCNGRIGGEFVGGDISGEFFVGQALHFVNGIVFACCTGSSSVRSLPIKNTNGGNISRA